ncbi:hypothetical protein KBY57_08055 [Cyanobium sp. Aljojuca 7D2]|jgi:hypothetical protein|uniref:hypothetical protein n=1 Tax=Cyanobium sp. Aljojuca 7D2 TaxID=2823698 RepID=UPI0020CF3156|nr:hypothetical protein [Cyanobium sp. Aljojuca 7D2]MCP9891006.1 hypothetical protein [Cyanobium sp. Aljojuca 7D2]
MVFNRKDSFFLDLGSEGAEPAKVAIAEPKAQQPKTPPAKSAEGQSAPVTITAATPATTPAPSQASPSAEAAAGSSLTTAEAIAAELRAAQEALPPPSNATFAPDCLNPANTLRSRRRLAGANLAGFKDMASGMFRN